MVKNHQPTERDAIAKTIVGHAPRTGANASGTGLLGLQALLEQARRPTWRLWAKDAAIEKKDVLKARGYSWSPGESGRPKSWYVDVSDADKTTEAAWLRAKRDGAGTGRMGITDHRQRSVLGSMLVLG